MIATLLHWHDTMHHKRLYLVLAVLAALVHQPGQAACQFDHAVFRDAANRGYTLEFSPANGEDASVVALAQLRHTRRGVIFQFALAHASGYGRFYLTRTGTPDSRSYDVYYFDSRLIETSVDTASWVFVDGLGHADWYDTRNSPQLGNIMWKLQRCKMPTAP
jgi:hypothetical protein